MISGRNYYLITSLPALGELGSAPALDGRELLEHVADSPTARALVGTLLMADDLLERQAYLSGEIEDVSPILLTPSQVRDEEPLPDYLAGEQEQAPGRIAADAVWEAYFRHAATVAKVRRNEFLAAWVRHEVSLRNAVACERAKALELEPTDYVVAAHLGTDEEDFTVVLNDWKAAPDPLRGLKVLDAARWAWVRRNERYFTFADDELAAYAAKLILLHRWNRIAAEQAGSAASKDATQAPLKDERTSK